MKYEIEETAGYLIYRVGRLLRYRASQFFSQRDIEISPEQWVLLLQVRERGQATMSDLVDKAVNDHPNVTRLVGGLVKMGYVERARNPSDRRSQLVSMTQAGEALVNVVLPDLLSEKAVFFEGLNQGEVTKIISLLKIVLGNLEK